MFGYENVTLGIYMIKNKKTGQMYIGQSKNIERRFREHCNVASIDVAIANEGMDNFDFIILEETTKDKLIEREKYWIQYYNTYHNSSHYNVCLTPITNLKNGNKRKFFLWDTKVCRYKKHAMFQNGRTPNPCRCFQFYYQEAYIPIGVFHDFVTCEIINRLIKEAIKDEIE